MASTVGLTPTADYDLVEIAERVPLATLCLETALARHGLVDAIPTAIDIAIPRGASRRALRAPCRLHQFHPAVAMLYEARTLR